MSLTSLQFFVLFSISVFIYYIVPKNFKWCALLGYSIYFFFATSEGYTVLYLLLSIISTWICTNGISDFQKANKDKEAKYVLGIGIIINLGLLAALKYTNFIINNLNVIFEALDMPINIEEVAWRSPIGISFYSLQIIAYLLDVYWKITSTERNILKTALFVGYYPQLTSGPIARHEEMKNQLYEGHSFEWKNVTFGFQRILWGIFKKLVISSRAGIIVDTIYADTARYDGFYIWIAAALFMLQLYTDFSGCMDIIIGASECYGIVLPENFRTPFFSKSVQEFWQRWHITLGAWLKDYILYPVLRTKVWRNLTKWVKAHIGKKAAKQIPSYLGMLCVWLLIGLWHGGEWKFIIGMGLWFWTCIVLSQVCDPLFKMLIQKLHINTECFSWRLFQSLRVFVLVAIGNMFFRLGSIREVFHTLKMGISDFNIEIFFNDSLYLLGLDQKNFNVMLVASFVLLIVSCLNEKKNVRIRLEEQNIVFRWSILLVLIFAIIIFGQYGVGYDATSFIYGEF